MTDSCLVEAEPAVREVGRSFDIRAAGRHSRRVRRLRWAIVIGVPIGVIVLAGIVFHKPLGLPLSLGLGSLQINGTRIEIGTPHMTGYRQDGSLYSVKASLGIQDLATPGVFEMRDVDANLGMADNTTSHVTASSGIYDSKGDSLRLTGAVHLRNSSGYDVHTGSASINLDSGEVAAEASVHVALDGTDVTADTMNVTDDGHKITFVGSVHSTFHSSQTLADGGRP